MSAPETITDRDGNTWTVSPDSALTRFAERYRFGQRTATLMTHHEDPTGARLISASGKVLQTLRLEAPLHS